MGPTARLLAIGAITAMLLTGACGQDGTAPGDEAAGSAGSSEPSTTASQAGFENWCSQIPNLALLVSTALESGNPTSGKATFENIADALVENAPNGELEQQVKKLVDGVRPVFDGEMPSQQQLDDQTEALNQIKAGCGP